jgi:hypothetical protein
MIPLIVVGMLLGLGFVDLLLCFAPERGVRLLSAVGFTGFYYDSRSGRSALPWGAWRVMGVYSTLLGLGYGGVALTPGF